MVKPDEHRVARNAIVITLSFTVFLWLILFIEWAGNFDFTGLGIYPRTLHGTIGILTAPLIHGGIFHLLSNTLPLILLGIGLFYFYHRIALEVFIWIYLTTGFWVWIIGRSAYHIGASGIIYGLMSFILISGMIRRNVRSLAVSMAVFVLYSGMIYGIFPVEPHVSWESHLMGLLTGVVLAVFFRKEPIYVGETDGEALEEEDEPGNDIPRFSEPESDSEKNINVIYKFKPKKK